MEQPGDSETVITTESKVRFVKIPKQDFKINQNAARPFLDEEIVKGLKEVFDLFSSTDTVNPYKIKQGLRLVGKLLL
jgi:hypothetical protein